MNIVVTFFAFCWSIVADGILAIFDTNRRQGFQATFGSELLIANRWNKGLLISRNRKMTRQKSYENVLIIGPIGSGKTSRLLIKQLLSLRNRTILVNDPSGELFQLCSGYLSQFFKILVLNFSDSKNSAGYNLLARIKRSSDINKIAHALVSATIDKNSSDPYWSLQSKTLLSILIRITLSQEAQYRNMANVLHLLHIFSYDINKIDVLIVKSKDKRLLQDYKSFISTPEKTLQNIVSSTKASLQLFEDEEIAKVTSNDSIRFETLRNEPTIIFLRNSVSDMKYINTLNGLFFEQFFGHLLQHLPTKNELDVFCLIDEASSLYIPMLPTFTANNRKHRISNVACIQAKKQLDTFYKNDADNIISNCVTKIYLPGITDMDTLRELEILSGKRTIKNPKGGEKTASLISIDEIRQLPENRTLIVSGNHPIILGRTSQWFQSYFTYKRYCSYPPFQFQSDIPDNSIAYIP